MVVRFCLMIFLVNLYGISIANEPSIIPSAIPSAPTTKSSKGKLRREKDTEGSEALGRFEADTVIKSKYLLHGQPLEVDPD